MVNEFPILSFAPAVYWHAVVNCNVKYADVSAGDMAEIWTDKRGYLGTFQIAQVHRSGDNARIVFDGTKPWNALFGNQASPVPAENQTGTLKIVQKNALRPKFWQYYDEYATPIFTSLYKSVQNYNGKAMMQMPQGDSFPENIAAEIISSSGKYSGVKFPADQRVWTDMNMGIDVIFDIPYNGDDSGVLVYTETPVTQQPVYNKPYVDATQVIPTVVNPTDAPITVTSISNSGQKFSQVVQAGETQVIAAPVEKAPAPVFVVPVPTPSVIAQPTPPEVTLKSAPIKTLNDDEYKVMIAAKMREIVANAVFIKLIQDNYKNGTMGYTQSIATNAVKELKEAGEIPINQWGIGIWGQADWIRANYPKDDYIPSGNPPVIIPVNPNPGATPTPGGNPGSTTDIPATTVTVNPGQGSATNPPNTNTTTIPVTSLPVINKPVSEVVGSGLLSNPMVQIVLVGLAFFLIIKLFSKQ